jgi:ectoine hydroxylase-related dioxygenase (phytanoyl-CoA dioxygenase family)
VQWHQDFSYWDRTGPMAHLTVHIALDDQTLENGALHWVPGSHRWTRNGGGPLPQAAQVARDKMAKAKAAGGGDELAAASFTTDMDALYRDVLNDDERAQWEARPPETVLLKAGHAAFHHALSVHGSWGNRSDRPRRSLVLNYFAHGTRALMDGELLKGAPAVRSGEVLEGLFHPVVFDTRRIDVASLPVSSV